jgi:hypothetical protein
MPLADCVLFPLRSETQYSLLKARLQRALARYNALILAQVRFLGRAYTLKPVILMTLIVRDLVFFQPAPATVSPTWSTSKISNPLLNPRRYLKQGLMDESDSDTESEDEAETVNAEPEKMKGNANGTTTSGGNRSQDENEKHLQEDDEEEEEIRLMEMAARQKGEREGTVREQEKQVDEVEMETKPTALQSERSIQDSLSGELLRMAGILKMNSMAFADALERDRKILEEAGEKLQGNLTLMTRTRGRLGEYSQKARGMGWLTLGTVAAVCMSWVVMFILIRLT